MSLQLFDLVLDRIEEQYKKSELDLITFATYNEPTLDPHLKDRLLELTKRSFRYWFISNGTGITKDLVDFIIESRIQIAGFHINLPSIERSQYEVLVKASPDNVERLKTNLKYLLENLDKVNTTLKWMVHGKYDTQHEHNYQTINKFVNNFANVSVHKMGVVDRAGMLREHIDASKIEHPENSFLECSVKYLDNLYIGIDGNIFLCCQDYYEESSFGNLKESNIHELLNSKEREGAERDLMRKFCRKCAFAKSSYKPQDKP